MRRLALLLVVLLVGCAPALAPTLEREADAVTVVVAANEAVYDVTLSVLNVTSEDERCAPIGPDIGCALGDIMAGESVIVAGTASGEVHCVAFGFKNESLSLSSYQPWRCEVVP